MITLTRIKLLDALRFGRLLIIGKAANRNGQPYALCRCDCGKEKEIAMSSLRRGLTQSCGCFRKEKGPANKRHGLHASRTYKAWLSMRQRCCNPNNPAYPNYGGRGITIAPAWDTFDQFLADMGEVPEGMTLERKDNDKGYGPDNCVWADRATQARNTRKCRQISHNGQTKTLGEWADEHGLNRATLAQRLDTGWPIERALATSPLAYHNREAATV
jgi:hypothetical protein